jgi:hypothetical protein
MIGNNFNQVEVFKSLFKGREGVFAFPTLRSFIVTGGFGISLFFYKFFDITSLRCFNVNKV